MFLLQHEIPIKGKQFRMVSGSKYTNLEKIKAGKKICYTSLESPWIDLASNTYQINEKKKFY